MSQNPQNKTLKVTTVFIAPIRVKQLDALCGLLSLCDRRDAHKEYIMSAARELMIGMGYTEADYYDLGTWNCVGPVKDRLNLLFRDTHWNYYAIMDYGEYVRSDSVEWDCVRLSPHEVAALQWRYTECGLWLASKDDKYYITYDDPEEWLERINAEAEDEDEEDTRKRRRKRTVRKKRRMKRKTINIGDNHEQKHQKQTLYMETVFITPSRTK